MLLVWVQSPWVFSTTAQKGKQVKWEWASQGHNFPLPAGPLQPALQQPCLDSHELVLCCPKEVARRKTQEAACSRTLRCVRVTSWPSSSSVKTSSLPCEGEAVKSRELACSRLQCNTFASSVEGPGTQSRLWHCLRRQLSHTGGRSGSSSLWLAGRWPLSYSWPDPAMPPGSGM